MSAYVTLLLIILIDLSHLAEVRTQESYDTIVIGLGSAGTTAATTLARAGRRVLALEAEGRIGGRVRTEKFGDGVVEVGAEWIHGQSPSRVYDLAVQNNVHVVSQTITLDLYSSDGTKNDPVLKDFLFYCINLMEKQSEKVEESLAELITRKFKEYLQVKKPELLENKEFVDHFLEFVNHVVNNYEASYDWTEVSTYGSYEPLSGDLNLSWHAFGYKTFFEILLNTYKNGTGLPTLDIKLNKEVTNIEWPKDTTGNVVVTCKDGDQYTASNVIITVSVGVLKERYATLFNPPLPEEKVAAINGISIGVIAKIILQFDRVIIPFSSFLYWTLEDKKKLPEDDWIKNVVLAIPPLGASNTLTLWTYGDTAKLVETLPDDEVKRKSVELLQTFVGSNFTVPQPSAMLRSNWFSNPYTRGSYTYDNMEMPKHPDIRETLGAPLVDADGTPRVLFAGEATDKKHFSTVHGASDTGYREAMRLLPSSKI